MYWAINEKGEKMFPDFRYTLTHDEFKKAMFTIEDDINETPVNFEHIEQLYNDLITEEKNGGFEQGTFTEYEDVFDFISGSEDVITPLLPVNETSEAIEKIIRICIENRYTDVLVPGIYDGLVKKLEAAQVPKSVLYAPNLHEIVEYVFHNSSEPYNAIISAIYDN